MNNVRRFAPAAARTILGLVFFVFGLNGFLGFLPQPPIPEPAASTVGTSQAGVEQFGRGSPLPMAKARIEGDALAQKR